MTHAAASLALDVPAAKVWALIGPFDGLARWHPAVRACVTLREETEWPETCGGGWNVLAGTEPARIVEAAQRPGPTGEPAALFGDGHAAQRMVELLRDDPSHGARRG